MLQQSIHYKRRWGSSVRAADERDRPVAASAHLLSDKSRASDAEEAASKRQMSVADQ